MKCFVGRRVCVMLRTRTRAAIARLQTCSAWCVVLETRVVIEDGSGCDAEGMSNETVHWRTFRMTSGWPVQGDQQAGPGDICLTASLTHGVREWPRPQAARRHHRLPFAVWRVRCLIEGTLGA